MRRKMLSVQSPVKKVLQKNIAFCLLTLWHAAAFSDTAPPTLLLHMCKWWTDFPLQRNQIECNITQLSEPKAAGSQYLSAETRRDG